MRKARASPLLIALVMLSACVTSQTAHRYADTRRMSLQGEPVVGLEPAPGTDLEFQIIEPFTIDVTHIYSNNSHGYVAEVSDYEARNCFDMLAVDHAMTKKLEEAENRSPMNVRYNPEPIRFKVTFDARASVSHERASYQLRDDMLLISSPAWYLSEGEQVFLSCPEEKVDWLVYRVNKIEAVASKI